MVARLRDAVQRGTNAARPAATAVDVGTLYYDTTNSSLGRSTGAAWESVEGAGGLADQGTATFLDWTTAAAPAAPAAGKIRTYSKTGDTFAQKTSGGVETVFGAGGGGVTSPDWWHSDNAPASPHASNREFTAALSDTRVSHGTPKGTYAIVDDGLEWTQTATGATDLDVYAVAHTFSVGDYATIAFQPSTDWENSKLGTFVGFSNGTTFGTSDAVGAWATPSGPFIFLLNDWTNLNSRLADGAVVQHTVDYGARWGMRIKYEAANTWGIYSRSPGSGWRAVQTNYALTLSPTHILFGVAMSTNPTFTSGYNRGIRLECFRVND